jgi:hypothetical protein
MNEPTNMTGLTPFAAKTLREEQARQKRLGFAASMTGLASEAIIKAYGEKFSTQKGEV